MTTEPEKPQTVSLSRDPIWEGYGGPSFDDLQKAADEATDLREEVPSDVQGRFELVRDLIAHSYSEYDFLDAAAERALLTFEMALKRRLRDLGRDFNDKVPLAQLIEWGEEDHLFERSRNQIHALREIRNSTAAHPSGDSRLGPNGIHLVRSVVFDINQMHADLELRKERKKKRAALRQTLTEVTAGGAVLKGLTTDDGKQVDLLIHQARVLLVDNWEDPLEYVVGACPIFDPTPDAKGRVHVPQSIYLRAERWERNGSAVHLGTGDDEIMIHPIEMEENRLMYQEKWKNPLQEADRSVLDTVEHRLGRVRQALLRGDPIQAGPIVLGEPVTGTTETRDSSITIKF